MVLFDEVDDPLWDPILSCQVRAIFYVSDDHEGAEFRLESIVAIDPWHLVFDEVVWFEDFSDIVKASADTDKESICADGFCGGFSEGSDGDGVVVGTRSALRQLTGQWVAHIAACEKCQVGLDIEESFHEGEEPRLTRAEQGDVGPMF